MGDIRRELREELAEYTCPNCAHKFQVQTSIAVLSGTTQCPHCSQEVAAEGNISDAVKHTLESKIKGKELT
jgi:DNA-directed RNA polymerase subunit RPC12/RpoP